MSYRFINLWELLKWGGSHKTKKVRLNYKGNILMANLLELKSVVAGYGGKRVLHGVDLKIQRNEIVGLVGPNGSGKSTVLKSIFGMVKVSKGKIIYKEEDIKNRKTSKNNEDGICYIPQSNNTFDKLTVHENLLMGGILLKDRKELEKKIETVYDKFPKLRNYKNKICGNLSGGERQMVGIGRGLVMNPCFILIDEPSIGLAPVLVKRTMDLIWELKHKYKIAVLIVEQNVPSLLEIADRLYLLSSGKVIHEECAIDKSTINRIGELFLK